MVLDGYLRIDLMLDGDLETDLDLDGELGEFQEVSNYDYYTGDYEVTPSAEAQTSFVNTYGQSVSLTNQSFNQGDVLVVRARARSTSYVMGVGNLIIEEV